MLKRDEYPPGVPCWIDTAQPDPDAAVRFYGELFGWEFENVMPADSPRSYFIARLDGLGVAGVRPLADEMGPGAFWSTYVCVESADEAATKATQAGGSLAAAPFDVGDAGRTAAIADLAGAVFCVWEPKSHKGAEAVNANATWNWSELNTRGPEAATSFYGRVFGWKASAVELGGHESVMWLLPGYGDFLERLDPGLRRRHETSGPPRASRTRLPGCQHRRPTTSARRTGASPSRPTTPVRSPTGPPNSADRCSCRPSMPRSCGSRCSPIRRERSLP